MALNVPIDSLSEADLNALVANRVEETETLDYKRDMYGTSDNDRKELCRDVSAMANKRGGFLLIGIRDEQDCAAELVGIDEIGTAEERLLSCVLAGVEERINGIRTRQVPLVNGRHVLAVFIPPSRRAPHMVVLGHEDRCWIRHGKQKMRMSVAELRESCIRIEGLLQNTQRFLDDQFGRATHDFTLGPDQALLRITITPVGLMERFETDNQAIRRLMLDPPNNRPDGWTIATRNPARPTLHGLRSEVPGYRVLEVHRTGHVEFRARIDLDGFHNTEGTLENRRTKYLKALLTVEYTVSVLRFYSALARQLPIVDPVLIGWNLIAADDWTVGFAPGNAGDRKSWREHNLVIPEIEAPALFDPDKTAKILLDRVWQAFGADNAPYFSADQRFEPPLR
jgi:hypothetical protein